MTEKLPKEYIAYWQGAIYRLDPGGDWHVTVKHSSQISLETTDKNAAATRARNIHLSIEYHGWKQTMAALREHGWTHDWFTWSTKSSNGNQPARDKGKCKIPDCDRQAVTYDPGFCSKHARLTHEKCKVPDCDRLAVNSSGLCRGHYYRWRRSGDVQADIPLLAQTGIRIKCKVPDCDRLAQGRSHGFCTRHHYRWKRYGDPLHPLQKEIIRMCQIAGCDRKARARGFCVYHYSFWYRGELAAESHPR
jgi:hypothetical protein